MMEMMESVDRVGEMEEMMERIPTMGKEARPNASEYQVVEAMNLVVDSRVIRSVRIVRDAVLYHSNHYL